MLFPLIPKRVHSVLDYIVCVLLILSPVVCGYSDNVLATMIAVMMGSLTILYSLITDYELSLAHWIPMAAHLRLDLFASLVLLGSPWIFGFYGRIVWPHVTIGAIELLVVLLSAGVYSLGHRDDLSSGHFGRPGMA